MWGKSLYHEVWYGYSECRNCGLVFVNPRRSATENYAGVENELGSERHFVSKAIFDLPEIRRHIIEPVVKVLPPHARDGRRRRWLDVGCAIGNLLVEAGRAGYEPHGLELSRSMVDWAAANRPELDIRQGLIQDLRAGDPYDVVSVDNVLEHIHAPEQFLREIGKHLREQSVLIVRVPNLNNFARPWLQRSRKLATSFIIDPDAHPCNYSRRSLEALFARCGLRTQQVMEHLMISYPLKHILSGWTQDRGNVVRRFVARAYHASFLFDWIVPRGGIDITVIARPDKSG
jgi:SAM-dependent methyltransferase